MEEEKKATWNSEGTRDNFSEYNLLVSYYPKAYTGSPGRETTMETKKIWARLKEQYGMGMLFISIKLEYYFTQVDNVCV